MRAQPARHCNFCVGETWLRFFTRFLEAMKTPHPPVSARAGAPWKAPPVPRPPWCHRRSVPGVTPRPVPRGPALLNPARRSPWEAFLEASTSSNFVPEHVLPCPGLPAPRPRTSQAPRRSLEDLSRSRGSPWLRLSAPRRRTRASGTKVFPETSAPASKCRGSLKASCGHRTPWRHCRPLCRPRRL